MAEERFNAVFMDAGGCIQSLPTYPGGVALLVGFLTIEEGWDFLGLEPSDIGEDCGEESEENSGTEGESVG